MLDFRRLDRHHDVGRAAIGLVAPVMLPENAKRLSNGFEQALRCDLDRMLDALRVPTCDPACSNGHWPKLVVSAAVTNGHAPLPTSGKRGDEFRRQLETLSQEQREICQQRASKQIAAAKRNKASIVSYQHLDYPFNVLESNNPVPILYIKGSSKTLTTRQAVACVGSRNIRRPSDELQLRCQHVVGRLVFARAIGLIATPHPF